MTATELNSNDDFKTFDFCKRLEDSELEKRIRNKKYLQQNDVEYQYTQCERYSFPIARTSTLMNSLQDFGSKYRAAVSNHFLL